MLRVSAPGRINIIGEHTDYNGGFVLPAAIDKKTTVSIQKNGHPSRCKIHAENVQQQFEFDLNNFQAIQNGWPNYVMGVVAELQKLGHTLTGFDASFHGNVPIGGGMSSSAALECSFAVALNELFQLSIDPISLTKAAQLAEHNFAGMKCGIMDQFASMMGKKDHVMLLDCRSYDYQFFPIQLGQYDLLLLNTKVSHSLAESAYNTRREQCEEGVQTIQKKYPSVTQLRDADISMLDSSLKMYDYIIYNRCAHVVRENQRVIEACNALKNNQLAQLGKLMYASHDSLSKQYEVSCQELDYLVDYTRNKKNVLGARMMGGGFGGCTINLVEKNNLSQLVDEISKSYHQSFGIQLEAYRVSIANGASIIENN